MSKENIILIIEPDRVFKEKLQNLLAKDYSDSIYVSDGNSALFEARQYINNIKLVLINYKLPDNSSLEIVQQIENLGVVVPNFIFLADDELPENIIRSMTIAGAYDYLLKTAEDSKILQTIKEAYQGITKDDFRRGAAEEAERRFTDAVLLYRNLKMAEEANFLLQEKMVGYVNERLQWPLEFMKDTRSELNFAHGGYGNRKNYPLKLLLRELENDTGEKARAPWRFKILIVEDEVPMQQALKGHLEEEYYVLIADTGEKAFDIIKNHPDLDIVLLDIGLPDIKGTELIKKSNELYHINYLDEENYKINGPNFIALTAFHDAETIKQITKDGATDYITKPFSKVDLLSKIKKATSKRYYYTVIKELLDILTNQKLSFKTRLLLTDYEIARVSKAHGSYINIPPDATSVTYFFREYYSPETVEFGTRLPGMSLETNLKEYILHMQSRYKKLNNLNYVPLTDDHSFVSKEEKRVNRTIPSQAITDKECKELGVSLLMVEDEELFLNGLKYTFEDIVYKTYTSLNGKDALKTIEEHPEISIILVDMNLPDMSGQDLMNAILDLYRTKIRTFLPQFIIMTGYDAEALDYLDRAKYNIAHILSKGTEKNEMINAVKSILIHDVKLTKVKK